MKKDGNTINNKKEKIYKIIMIVMDVLLIPFTIYQIINKEYNYIAWFMLLLCNLIVFIPKKN